MTPTIAHQLLAAAIGAPTVAHIFPWQRRLLDKMLAGELPSALDIPTGLGKTSVMAIWLVARAAGAPVPRRLIYVVDRRVVVDQATTVAEGLREFVSRDPELRGALGLGEGEPLPISTLRGQHIDNRAWLADPSKPAIVLATVDMAGSRLLFEGYGVTRRMRSYHAGLLGVDALVALDEAHLVPPFELLLREVESAAARGLGPLDPSVGGVLPPFRLMSLSATGGDSDAPLRLDADDLAHAVVAQRMRASKRLELRDQVDDDALPDALAAAAWQHAAAAGAGRYLVFCDKRKDAIAVAARLERHGATHVELLVGARRVFEREVVAGWLKDHGFIAGTGEPGVQLAFVVATSAGEVGVDLDATHMVSDLVPWERMVQRLGRVNRRGERAADVVVIPGAPRVVKKDDLQTAAFAQQHAAVLALLGELPRAGAYAEAGPAALATVRARARTEPSLRSLLGAATTPAPLRPALSRPLLESWSMTSLEEHAGRPEVAPWLRGWAADEEPQVTLVWRDVLPVDDDGAALSSDAVMEYFDVAPPRLEEALEAVTWDAARWLQVRVSLVLDADKRRSAAGEFADPDAAGLDDAETLAEPAAEESDDTDVPLRRQLQREHVIGFLLRDGHAPRAVLAVDVVDRERREELEPLLAGSKLVLDTRIGGLRQGLLDVTSDNAVDALAANEHSALRIRRSRADDSPSRWRTELRLAIAHDASGDEREWLVIETPADVDAASEAGRALSPVRAQLLDEHGEWTEAAARGLAEQLNLPAPYAEMLATAARLHDEGKRWRAWQQAFGAPPGTVLAKSTRRPNLSLLRRYRHELGSLPYAERSPRLAALSEHERDLCLHLIAAHHGYARPLLRTDGAEESPSKLAARAREIALRFARLERKWGPWGLAWWEALLRAADQLASKRNDQHGGGDNG